MIDTSDYFILADYQNLINKTYIFNFPIEEVFKALTDKDLILKIYNYQFNILNSIKDDFSEGNEITFAKNKYIITLKIDKVIKTKDYCQIKGKTIQHPLEFKPIILNIELFWDSIKEVTVFNGQINMSKSTSEVEIIDFFKDANIFPAKEIDEYLKNTVKNLEQDESIIVNVNIDDFWKFITQLESIQLFLSMPKSEISIEGNNIIKIVDKNNNNIIRLIQREKKVDDSNYTLYLESFDSLISMPLQSMQIQLVKIDENSTLIIYKHIILDYIPYNALRSNSGNKQKILKKVKKKLENEKSQ